MAARSRLIVEAHDNILTYLNGGDHWVECITGFIHLKMGECIRLFYLIMMHFQDYKMILGMEFLTQVEVSIMPYLRTLAFMERGTQCTIITMEKDAINSKNLTMLESSTRLRGGWLEECGNKCANYRESLGSGRE